MRAGACAHATSSPLMELGFIHCGNSEATFYRAASGNDPVSIALQQGEVFCLELAKSWLTWTSDQAKSHPIHLKRIVEPRPAGILHSQACTKWPGWGGGGGILLGILGTGVPAGSPNIDPISDHNIRFSTPVYRPGFWRN